jgi:hypothetical protein
VFLFLQQAGGGGGQDGITKADLVTSLKVGGLSLCHPSKLFLIKLYIFFCRLCIFFSF